MNGRDVVSGVYKVCSPFKGSICEDTPVEATEAN